MRKSKLNQKKQTPQLIDFFETFTNVSVNSIVGMEIVLQKIIIFMKLHFSKGNIKAAVLAQQS